MLNDGEQSNKTFYSAAYTRLARLWPSRSSTSDDVHSWDRSASQEVALHSQMGMY